MLTKNAMVKASKGKFKSREQVRFQVLDPDTSLQQHSTPKLVTLSDGSWKRICTVMNSLSRKFSNEVRQYDVININLTNNRTSGQLTILGFEIVEVGLSSIIDAPQDYENYKKGQNATGQDTVAKMLLDEQDEKELTEIGKLTPYDQDWKIKGRIIKKTKLNTFKNRDGGEGCVFNIVVLDEGNTRIQGIFFSDVAREWHTKVNPGVVYVFDGGDIRKVRNPKYNNTGNDLEIIFNRFTQITEVQQSEDIPKFFYKFINFTEIEDTAQYDAVDVLAIVVDPGTCSSVSLRSGEEKMRKTVRLADDSGVACDLTLWGEEAQRFNFEKDQIVAFAELIIREFRGKKLSFGFQSQLIEDDLKNLPKYIRLMAERNRGVNITKNVSQSYVSKRVPKKIAQIDEEVQALLSDQYESKETKLYFNTFAMVSFTKDKISYPSCHNDNCKKKVVSNFNKKWECARCNKTYDEPLRKTDIFILFYLPGYAIVTTRYK